MVAVNDTTGRAASLRVTDDGELKIAGTIAATPGAATDAKLDEVITALGGLSVSIAGDVTIDATGLATTAKQDTGNASLASIDTKSSTIISGLSSIDGHVDGLEASASSIDTKLTGVATAANQTTANTSLSNIDTNAGATADAAVAAGATGSIAAKLRRLTADIGALILQIPSALGKKSVATSLASNSKSGGDEYETVAASQTDQVMGATGAAGDYLEGVLCVVATAATSQVQIKDGAGSAITVLPNAVGPGVGTYYVPLGLTSTSGAWKITTAAGVSVIGIGDFT
jgi:hypothetical protein